ncbi:metalloproteinase inhibitor 2 isoform X2 [Coregonus clupeaformis]|uniref:metalloproteinase inhibitor 2 isoform X2 n=1 Tax=Coregonus clupeaformis TaxID=59861 RepID=UPI001BE0506E|nr:metalloproteinase inhibitor 2 isoform X2 [Coregonus clupeaformis]
MTWSVSSCFISLVVLFLWQVDEISEACTCMTVLHPQQGFCNADVVIRAKVVGLNVGSNTKYDIKQIKMFKGPDRVIHAVFTASSPAACGVTLQINKEYLFTGKLVTGRMYVSQCGYNMPWEDLSATQKKSLTHRYQSGCDCKIIRCTSLPCPISAPDECLWTDWLSNYGQSGPQAQNLACIKRRDGSCAWK